MTGKNLFRDCRGIIIYFLIVSINTPIVFPEVIRKITQNGNIKEIFFYSGGKEIAREIIDEKGNIQKSGVVPDGIVRQYDNKGQLFLETNYRKGEQEGVIRLYYETGRVMQEANYKNGKLDDKIKIISKMAN